MIIALVYNTYFTENSNSFDSFKAVNGKIVFTPGEELQKLNNGQNQEVVFDYTISDGNGGSDSANVKINVTGLDDGKTINATICGTKDIAEGNSGWYNVQLELL